MSKTTNITPISSEEKKIIKNKTAYGLPDRPSYSGMKAAEIKKAFWSPVVDDDGKTCVILLIERIISEANSAFAEVLEAISNNSVSISELDEAVCNTNVDITDAFKSIEELNKELKSVWGKLNSGSLVPFATPDKEDAFLRIKDGKWDAVVIPYAEGEEY